MNIGQIGVTIVGNLTHEPELRYTPNDNIPVCSIRVAVNDRKFDRDRNEWVDGDTVFMEVHAWRALGENLAAKFTKGQSVIVYGQLTQQHWTAADGSARSKQVLRALTAGPDLRFADRPAASSGSTNTAGSGSYSAADVNGEVWP